MGKRLTNFELLRIICIFLIILHHASVHGGFCYVSESLNVNNIFMIIMSPLGSIAVNIFVILAGYFGVEGKFRFRHLLKILLTIEIVSLFWNIVHVILSIRGYVEFDINNFFPIILHRYSYIFEYIFLYLCSPILNKYIVSISRIRFRTILVCLIFNYSVLYSVFKWIDPMNENVSSFTMNIWFITLYLVGAYLKLYVRLDLKKCMCGGAINYLMLNAFLIIYNAYYLRYKGYVDDRSFFTNRNFVFTFFVAVYIVLIFTNIKISYNRWVNWIASSSLCTFLFHDNIIARICLWNGLFKQSQYENSIYLIPYLLVIASTVFCLGICINYMVSKIVTLILRSSIYEEMERMINYESEE